MSWFTEVFDTALEWLKANQFASGGIVLGVGAMVYSHGGSILSAIIGFISRRIFVTIKIDRWTYGFEWIRSWLKGELENKRKIIHEFEIDASICNNKSDIKLKQSDGRWLVCPNGFRVFANMSRVEEQTDTGTKIYSKMSLTTMRWNKKKLEKLMSQIGEKYGNKPPGQIYTPNSDNTDWEVWCSVPHTKLEHVILPSVLRDDILSDLDAFLKAEKRYRELGISYKRGYLLFGPPGNGKTSFIRALAHHLNKSIAFVKASKLSQSSVQNLISRTGSDKIIVIEDIDRANVVNGGSCNQKAKAVRSLEAQIVEEPSQDSLQAILNLLDGVQGGNGQIIITTANHPERLDPAFLRPGRIDRKFELPNGTNEQAVALFIKFFGEEHREAGEAFASMLPEGMLSMARIQQHLIENQSDHGGVISNINRLLTDELTKKELV
tara:strand:- start:1713 stop:3020 length:1308 start_codon:yes stop_codon:yes gene_type:complete